MQPLPEPVPSQAEDGRYRNASEAAPAPRRPQRLYLGARFRRVYYANFRRVQFTKRNVVRKRLSTEQDNMRLVIHILRSILYREFIQSRKTDFNF